MRKLKVLQVLGICFYSISCLAQPTVANSTKVKSHHHHHAKVKQVKAQVQPVDQSPVESRAKKESTLLPNYFAISTYKPNYLLPYYYTGSPDNVAYQHMTPDKERLSHAEIKYQISLKVPVWKNMFHSCSSLYFAYTQQSYWQLYNTRSFFRETDYEPEVFVANEPTWSLLKKWDINFLNVGAVHQSNGQGNTLERSWNRIYVEAIASPGNWMISVKPWYVISTNKNNTNIAKYLGYGNILVAYKLHQHVFTLQTHNLIESQARRATAQVTWSFPLIPYVKGYVQVFSGYGQSLIEYNHRTNSAGVGIALSDWV